MYEIFNDGNKKIIETGNILFANLILSGEDNSLYYFVKREVQDTMIKMEKFQALMQLQLMERGYPHLLE